MLYSLEDLIVSEIILASSSPRRRLLLEQINIPFRIILPVVEEILPEAGNFAEVVEKNAEIKARSVVDQADGALILGADTLVELDGLPLGKPNDADDAHRMLKTLSGRDHFVHSGIVLLDSRKNHILRAHEVTRVFFRKLRDWEIEEYIASGEPMDKAGSYGIQGRGAVFIRRVEGCFFNVMGLPLTKLWEMLFEFEMNL